MRNAIRWILAIFLSGTVGVTAEVAGGKAPPPPVSYGVNYGGRYRDAPVKIDGKLGPDGANQENWNNLKSPVDVNASGGASFTFEITDQNGNNPIALTTTDKGGAGGNDGGGPSTTNFQRLYNSGLRDAGGHWQITTKEAPFPGTYDVYIYAPGGGRGYGVTSGTTATWTSKSGGGSGTFDLDQNYHVFSGLSGPLNLYGSSAIVGFSIVDPNGGSGAQREAQFLAIPLKDIDGKETSLKAFEGKTILLVNVASKSGYTPQMKGLEALYQKYQAAGLVVVGIPSNDFGGQEPGTNAEIKAFYTGKYQATFPLMEKMHVKGVEQHPLYAEICGSRSPFPGEVKWNFGKFVLGRDGKMVARFAPGSTAEDAGLVKAIEAELAKGAPKGK